LRADQLDVLGLRRAWPSIAAQVKGLHSLPTDQCPFDRGLGWLMSRARDTVREGRVVADFLPATLEYTPPTEILDRVEAELPARLVDEREHLVVCHGDLCLPNILVDTDSHAVSALIDLGRLGTADPYGDIALLLSTAREAWSDEATAARADQQFSEVYGTDLDPVRHDFYLRLDPLTW
jgi:streptomycin 3"-kinase